MTWDIQVLPRAEKALKKLDKTQARRVRDALVRLGGMEDPASACKALGGPLTGLWRYRVGDYRVILDIRRSEVLIVAVDLGHRSEIY
ncbi:type II toxin-antitoxin system RelE/ParE family toxin [Nostocoides sp. F2B08]|uniref:type II toxin-antitoxin system RelE family toxin n=1 Tax=Nostocoides sp. F2B08 TaxID=2653936 RepID=UPI001263B5DC|nr:type II toxin-antitoxin system RelE/ParE family toxin [Tetrasphaera sp. F2B08]KAB7740025.1 type II toxin-antitoxin system RelE/ParE family toxin [Tetrasphaera sp. F2B08]